MRGELSKVTRIGYEMVRDKFHYDFSNVLANNFQRIVTCFTYDHGYYKP